MDKGYDNPTGHETVEAFGYTPHIQAIRSMKPGRGGQRKARRWIVERTLAWLSNCRAILVRYNKNPINYLGRIPGRLRDVGQFGMIGEWRFQLLAEGRREDSSSRLSQVPAVTNSKRGLTQIKKIPCDSHRSTTAEDNASADEHCGDCDLRSDLRRGCRHT